MRRTFALLPRRLLVLVAGVALAALLASGAVSRRPSVLAQVADFALGTPNCNVTPGLIPVINTSGATNPLSTLAIQIVPPTGPSFGPTQINGVIVPAGTYSVAGNATILLEVGPGATTSPPITGTTLPNNQHIALPSTNDLAPNVQIFLYDSVNCNVLSSATCGQSAAAAQRTFFVATNGSDTVGGLPNTQCSPETPTAGFPGSSISSGPCLTIQNALNYARDGDTIQVDTGIYEVCSTINVSKLVKITANGNRVILHSFTGDTVFHVTAVGAAPPSGPGAPSGSTGVGASPSINVLGGFTQFAQIDGLAIGGATKPGAAAIVLDNDAYTAITNNVIGGDPIANPQFTCTNGKPQPLLSNPQNAAPETFGNAEGIILANSDHPFIANNDILGAAIFSFSPILATGQVLTGFGIVTQECLGLGPDASDAVTLLNNLITRNVNAGIWLCSDGGGLHQIRSNVLRNNGRGLVLRAIDNTVIDSNTITGDYQDGIVIYDAANNNAITNNTIESHQTPGAAGIRLGDFGGGLFPLATTIGGNTLLRNWVDIVIAGARNTQLYGNTITADRDRTGILLQVGSTGAPAYTQPSGTVIGVAGQPPNKIISNGQCGATAGCAIRLDQGVTVNVDATGSGGASGGAHPSPNNFGLPPGADVNTVLWHKPNDPGLGFINTGSNVATPTPTPSSTATPTPTPTATVSPTPTATPSSSTS